MHCLWLPGNERKKACIFGIFKTKMLDFNRISYGLSVYQRTYGFDARSSGQMVSNLPSIICNTRILILLCFSKKPVGVKFNRSGGSFTPYFKHIVRHICKFFLYFKTLPVICRTFFDLVFSSLTPVDDFRFALFHSTDPFCHLYPFSASDFRFGFIMAFLRVYYLREPRKSALWQILDRHYEDFERNCNEKFEKRY